MRVDCKGVGWKCLCDVLIVSEVISKDVPFDCAEDWCVGVGTAVVGTGEVCVNSVGVGVGEV